jgi:hypothetical protein
VDVRGTGESEAPGGGPALTGEGQHSRLCLQRLRDLLRRRRTGGDRGPLRFGAGAHQRAQALPGEPGGRTGSEAGDLCGRSARLPRHLLAGADDLVRHGGEDRPQALPRAPGARTGSFPATRPYDPGRSNRLRRSSRSGAAMPPPRPAEIQPPRRPVPDRLRRRDALAAEPPAAPEREPSHGSERHHPHQRRPHRPLGR